MQPSDAAPTDHGFDLVDINQVADRLGVTPATVRQWRTRRQLPDSDFPHLANPVWRWSTIRVWAIDTGRI